MESILSKQEKFLTINFIVLREKNFCPEFFNSITPCLYLCPTDDNTQQTKNSEKLFFSSHVLSNLTSKARQSEISLIPHRTSSSKVEKVKI